MSSIKEVALHAKVSTATVSRVLSGKNPVSSTIKARVLKSVKALSYRPNRVARSLRVQKSNIIGLIVADIQNTFFTRISRIIQDEAFKRGYNIFLCNTDEKIEKEKTYIELMKDEHVAGIIFSPASNAPHTTETFDVLEIPCVCIDRQIESTAVDAVVIDNMQAAYTLTEHLFSIGKKRPIFVADEYTYTTKLRVQGFIQSMRDHGITSTKSHIFSAALHGNNGYAITDELLRSDLHPDAIIVTNGLLAGGCFRKLKELNISIPQDIAFACFDETMWTNIVSPTITVIKQPTYDIGKNALELLLHRIKGGRKHPPQQITLNSKLIIRESTTLSA